MQELVTKITNMIMIWVYIMDIDLMDTQYVLIRIEFRILFHVAAYCFWKYY